MSAHVCYLCTKSVQANAPYHAKTLRLQLELPLALRGLKADF